METKEYQKNEMPSIGSPNPSADSPAPVREEPYIGAVFKDRYLIEKKIGQGGIGAVYLARDRQLHSKLVVIKVLLEEAATDEWFKKKFRQEVEALARLDHPGIVGILGAGDTPDGKPFLVMQYIKGPDLRSMIQYEGMAFDRVAMIVRQVGRALSAAHEKGVLHCDLKPENIMLQELGENEYQAKIVDFGIAKIRNSQISAGDGDTKVGGTIFYMAPEQVQGNPSDASDIFALGVIAYEMLTGRRPFTPPNQYLVLETLRAGVKVKPQGIRTDLPPVAQEIIMKALSYDSGERYERARDFSELLAQALTTDLEMPASVNADDDANIEMAHVVFMDIVGYSKLPSDRQRQMVKELQQIVSGTETFQRSKASNQLISRSTGDGMALVFFTGPITATECAIEIARALRTRPHIGLRLGINSGPVYRVKDLNETIDVAGAGINMAQRVMDCGDAGHILLSKSSADVLKELSEWRERIHDIGEHKVKHGVSVRLYNFYTDEIGIPQLPVKLRKKRRSLITIISLAIIILAAATIAMIYSYQPALPSDDGTGSTETIRPVGPERMFSYWLMVQKCPRGKPCEQPFRLADATYIFEENFRVRLNVTTPQLGYFYALNESLEKLNGDPRYIILYPATTDKQDTLQIEIPQDDWFEFDNKKGTERLWLLWSVRPVAELEAVKGLANADDKGMIKEAAQNKALADLLKSDSSPRSESERDEIGKQTRVKAKGDLIIYPLNLEHR